MWPCCSGLGDLWPAGWQLGGKEGQGGGQGDTGADLHGRERILEVSTSL